MSMVSRLVVSLQNARYGFIDFAQMCLSESVYVLVKMSLFAGCVWVIAV